MNLAESVFVDAIPVGKIVVDTASNQIAFIPRQSPCKLPQQDWQNLEQLRNAIVKAYKRNDSEFKGESEWASANQKMEPLRPNLILSNSTMQKVAEKQL